MGLFRNSESRHLVVDGIRTCIALEPQFWKAADVQAESAGIDWKRWASNQLSSKPEEFGRASWLRVSILDAIGGGK